MRKMQGAGRGSNALPPHLFPELHVGVERRVVELLLKANDAALDLLLVQELV